MGAGANGIGFDADLESWLAANTFVARRSMILRLTSALILLLASGAFAQQPPLYLRLDGEIVANLSLERVAIAFDGETSRSPNGLRTYWTVLPDFMQESPWSTVVYIADVGQEGAALGLSIDRHANVVPVVRWINDELLYLQVWWGRIAASDLVLDVVTGEFIYRKLVYFPPDLPTPDNAVSTPPFQLALEHVAGALPPAWQAVRLLSSPEARQIEVTTLPPMVTECYLEPSDAELVIAHDWLERFLHEQQENAPPRPTDTVCRNCPSYRLSWQLDGNEGHFEFSEARPYRYPALDVLFPLLERLLERMVEEGECAA